MTGARSPLESSAWLYLALVGAVRADGCASLRELVAAADCVNHAIITRRELEEGLGVLVAVGYAAVSSSGCTLTQAGADFWRQTALPNQSLRSLWPQVRAHLAARSASAPFVAAPDVERYVTERAYAEAVATYAVAIAHPLCREQ